MKGKNFAMLEVAHVEDFLMNTLCLLRLPGMAVSIVKDDQTIYLRGFGYAGPTGRPMTPQTPFIIGSLSKSFTALAIMQLIETGRVELQAPVQRYLSWFCMKDQAASSSITIQHLLNHTSGISRYAGRELLAGQGRKTIEQQVRDLAHVSLSKPVGNTFQYSNTNYLILGLIIQVVSGQPYAEYIQEHIFAPLGMQHSFTNETEALHDGLATGYRWWFGIPIPAQVPFLADALPAAFLMSSTEDMAKWLIVHLNNGRFGETHLLSPDGIAELQKPTAYIESTGAYYCMGWRRTSLCEASVVMHTGEVANFRTEMVLLPEQRLGIVVLTNINNGLIAQIGLDRIAPDLVRLLLGQPPTTPWLTLRRFYMGLDLVIILLSLFQGWSLLRWRQRWHRLPCYNPLRLLYTLVSLIWDLGLPIAVITQLTKQVDAPWKMLRLYVPDVTYWLLSSLAVSFVRGVLKVVHMLVKSR